jgi:hypothetical protein
VADQDPTRGVGPDRAPDPDPWARHTPDAPYTVYQDVDAVDAPSTDDDGGPPAKRRPDPVALAAGVVALVVAGLGLLGPSVLGSLDPRWVLASAALAVGVVVLLTTVRPRPHRR